MRPLGFSTGALAKGDFRAGVEIQRSLGTTAVELSALRDSELPPLLTADQSRRELEVAVLSLSEERGAQSDEGPERSLMRS